MYYINQKFFYEEIVNKSKFISVLVPINKKEEIVTQLSLLKKEYPKATHYCYAYYVNNEQGSNDNGEPHGTAGLPILHAITTNKLQNSLLVVIRYFGGIKFGAGPLTRTYKEQAMTIIKKATLYLKKELSKFKLIYDYKYQNSIEELLRGDFIINQEFSEKIITTCLIEDKEKIVNLSKEINCLYLGSDFKFEKKTL